MKLSKVIIPLMLAAGLLASCDRPEVESLKEGAHSSLSIKLKNIVQMTKSGDELQTAAEKRVEAIDVLVFRDGILENHKRATGDGITSVDGIEVTLGQKVVYVFCNYGATRLASVTTIAGCEALRSELAENRRNAFVMSGKTTTNVATATATAEVSVRRDVSKVEITGAPEFSGVAAGGTVQGIYLINVPKVYDESVVLTSASSAVAWNFRNAVATAVDSQVSTLTYNANVTTPLYGMPNASPETSVDIQGNAEGEDFVTKLVIKATIKGKTYWYPIGIPDMGPNKYYKISSVKIAVLGSDNPNDYVTFTDFSVSIEVADWNEETVESRFAKPIALTGTHNGHDWVDLGLRDGSGNRIVFATMNIGASSETEYGDYFAWGETSVRYSAIDQYGVFTGATFVWNNTPYHIGDDETTGWSKYILTGYESYSTSGTADGLTTLEPSDDVASVMWGGSWKTPDISEFEQLINNTVYEIVSDSGRPGLKVTGKGDFSSSFIIFRAGGYADEDCLCDWGDIGYYMSRTTNNNPTTVLCMDIVTNDDEGGSMDISSYTSRYSGLSVRPVLVLPAE